MAYRFAPAFPKYAYQPGAFFLGVDEQAHEIGIMSERHAITIGGARSGKGAAILVQNGRRWRENILQVDPKGENTELIWQAREAMGQQFHALDPFHRAEIPARLRAGFNPFDLIQIDSPMGREDIMVISDGLVIVHDPKHMEWVDGTRDLISGFSAFVIETATDNSRNLGSVRNILLMSKDDLRKEIIPAMQSCAAFGGLARAAGEMLLTALDDKDSMEADFLNKAKRATSWLDSPQMRDVITRSTFHLSDLKTGSCTVSLVLPEGVMVTYAAFFRLFVRLALNVMAGKKKRACLFLLDEFHNLGRIDEISKAAGLMPGYGVHLWPFLQDLGQLEDLYGKAGMMTFFANADAHVFFANTDPLTLDFVSHKIGKFTPHDLAIAPPPLEGFDPEKHETGHWLWGNGKTIETRKATFEAKQQNNIRQHQHTMGLIGHARLPPDMVGALTGKGPGDVVARSMIVFTPQNDVLNLSLVPYFQPPAPHPSYPTETAKSQEPPPAPVAAPGPISRGLVFGLMVGGLLGGLTAWMAPTSPNPEQAYQVAFWLAVAGLVGGFIGGSSRKAG